MGNVFWLQVETVVNPTLFGGKKHFHLAQQIISLVCSGHKPADYR